LEFWVGRRRRRRREGKKTPRKKPEKKKTKTLFKPTNLQNDHAVLVVVHLLHLEKLSRREVHHVHVEVVVARLRQELAQTEHLGRCRQ
jgi:hypothetical protein